MGHEGHDHDHEHGHSHTHSHEHGHVHSHAQPHAHVRSPAGDHRAAAPAQVSTFVVTCSDTRSEADDESGHLLLHALEGAGHPIAGRRVIHDEPAAIRQALDDAQSAGARAVIFTGGTGIARRDSTIETLQPLFEKQLPGFGELFRALSFQEIGTAAMLTRACAGTWRGLVVFAIPGSANAARLAIEKLILPELGHLVRELIR